MYSRIRVSGFAELLAVEVLDHEPAAGAEAQEEPALCHAVHVQALIARLAGERAKTGTMLVPMRIRAVTAASWASEVSASSPTTRPS